MKLRPLYSKRIWLPAVEDLTPRGSGPLAGIHAAFEATRTADLLVLACDYARVDGLLLASIAELAADEDVTLVADAGGRDHTLVALWRRTAAASVSRALAEGRLAVRELLRELRVQRLDARAVGRPDLSRLLVNLNSPEDLQRLTGASGQDG